MTTLLCASLSLLLPQVSAVPVRDDLTIELFQLYREFTDQEVAARGRIDGALEFEAWRDEQAERAWNAARPYLDKDLETNGHYYLAGVLILAKHWKEALPHLDAYLADDEATDVARALAIRLQTRVLVGAWDPALEDLDRLVTRYPDHLNFPLFQFIMPALERETARERIPGLMTKLEDLYRGDSNYEKVLRDFREQLDRVGQTTTFPRVPSPPDGWPNGFDDGQKLTLLTFFRTAVPDNHRVLPFLSTVHRTFRDRGVRVLGLTVVEGNAFWKRFRASGDPQDLATARASVEAMRRGLKLDFPIGIDPERTYEASYAVEWQPHLALIDTHGRIVAFWAGAANFEWLVPRIEQFLATGK